VFDNDFDDEDSYIDDDNSIFQPFRGSSFTASEFDGNGPS